MSLLAWFPRTPQLQLSPVSFYSQAFTSRPSLQCKELTGLSLSNQPSRNLKVCMPWTEHRSSFCGFLKPHLLSVSICSASKAGVLGSSCLCQFVTKIQTKMSLPSDCWTHTHCPGLDLRPHHLRVGLRASLPIGQFTNHRFIYPDNRL